jgi:phosphopantetheinyl transferase
VQRESNERPSSGKEDASRSKLKCLARASGSGAVAPRQGVSFVKGWCKAIGDSASSAAGDRIDVWLASVAGLAVDSSHREILSDDEQLALDQIRSPLLRDRKLAGRILLRTGLSHAVDWRISPREWRIRSDANGRPVIAKSMPQLNFSISYAEPVVVIAISKMHSVGIDVEAVEDASAEDLITAFCCPCEQSVLHAGTVSQNGRDFVRLWTLKEAYTKMVGLGHSIDFDSIGFSLDSLHLLHGAAVPAKDPNVHFETMWVSSGRTLSHVSLAVDFSSPAPASADLQVMTMASPGADAPAIHIPNINICGQASPQRLDRQ